MFKEVWISNVKHLLHESGYSLTEAASLLGTSKQYLSAILGETEPASTKESIMEKICFLLHTTPDRLYGVDYGEDKHRSSTEDTQELSMVPVELAILSERLFLSGEYAKAYACSSVLLQRHARELSPAARAQSHLLAGKSGCLAGMPEEALIFLKRALQLFQKRLSAQPDKYLPLCLDCYRYLGLACTLSGAYTEAVRWLSRACNLASKYPLLMEGMQGKMEEVVANLLRSAARQGTLEAFELSTITARAMATGCSFASIKSSIDREDLFVRYPLAWARGELTLLAAHQQKNLLSVRLCDVTKWDPMHIVHYSLLLFILKDTQGLCALLKGLDHNKERQWPVRALVLKQLNCLGHNKPPLLETVVDEQGISPLLQGLLLAFQGLNLEALGHLSAAHHCWQLALGKVRRQKEAPLYVFMLNWYIQTTGRSLPEEELMLSVRLLKRAVCDWEGLAWE